MRIPPYFPRLGALGLACALALPAQAAERAWSYSYNALGLIERADGPRTDVQDVTLYAYDSRGNLTQVTNALGQVTRLGDYDERGKPGSITDANGVTSSLAYTGVDGWLASVSTAGSTTRFDYDAVGQITRVTRGDGSWLSYEYDDARRLVAIGNNLGERLEYDVDTKGNRTAQRIKDASGSLVRQQQWAYDELGRLLRAVGAGGQTRSFAYDLNDNPVGETNPRQFAHSQAFDALDRLVGQSDPLGGKTQLAYDAQDNLTEVKDPRGVTTRYEYDGLGNLTRLVSPDSGTTTFEHDAAGNVIRRTDARGTVTEYRYDALNRLIERHSPSDPSLDVQYRYDLTADGNKSIGRLGAIEGARDSLVYRYDERGNLVEQVRSIRLDQQTLLDRVTYRYDAANQLLEIGYPSGLAIGYPRNAGGQVASVTLAVGDKAPSPLVGQIAYLPFGPLQRLTWGNGITLSREYDQDYQLLRQKVGPWQSDYQHDANGNIQQHRHSLWGTLDYQYDPLDRLTEERGVQGGRSYAYDAVGNRTQRSDNPASGGTASSQDYQYSPDSNRLTAIGAQAVTSDAAGNLTQDRAARKLAYDAQGRLQSVSRDGQQVAEYRYNALGQRIVKLTPESITTYLYGPDGQLLGEAEHDGSGRKLRAQYYLWLDSLPLATIDADYDAQGKVGNPTLLYLHGDHLDTPRLATDASGQIAWQWQSDAFGRGEALSQGSTQINLRFPGQYYDAESGLHYNYFRDYDPETGRYVESDPVETLRKLNNPEMTFLNSGESMLQATPYWEHGFTPNHNYTYSDNNPTAKSDKHGLSPNPTDNLIYTPDTNCTCTLECKKKFTGNGKSFLVGALCSKATTPFFGGVVCNSTIVMICGASCSQECNRAPSCEKEGSGNE
ncbi:TPA: RHS repeat protein [Pseudomonas aeruginosa]|uniref:RHS repeat domain-containing protein n=1 Tax=Pseudomonas aeruginosa TaxID=287 RepID=UPI000BA5538D|nr:RHS repeat domain-containing protein [Pseudomonas aeruginosa]MEB5206519.1 RHS repeat-associated core domain-containing protein [Pseudomonas aeruginosa]MEB5210438.1 RHS repeat-associated core domain-containing protein [Pseudomonas aeruginosa]MEB5243849.1 RHS repeat-associated core domain-containing protein [Pseudomonas aeruginosa]MEB5256908.1 RHS repeat-associated core domain-containing protein [Pseudomonas aeruginosa]MEB5262127.1 RHS repeat-associated core domain-containing protein [Pseudom